MSGVKHTPGPWFEQTGFSDDVEITAESRESMVAICSMDLGFTGHIGVEQEANARLIAAAPDHHAVALELDRLMLVIDSAVRFADPAFKDEVQTLLRANKAAIARARGEQDGGGE